MSKHPFYDDETIEAMEEMCKILAKMTPEERKKWNKEVREMRKNN